MIAQIYITPRSLNIASAREEANRSPRPVALPRAVHSSPPPTRQVPWKRGDRGALLVFAHLGELSRIDSQVHGAILMRDFVLLVRHSATTRRW